MNGANVNDLALLLPELILVGTALVLLLMARRFQNASAGVVAGTVFATLAAVLASVSILSDLPKTGFGGMITLDSYSQFFKVLIACVLILVTLLSVRRVGAERFRFAEYHALLLLASTGMMFAVSALDLLTLYLSLELTTICSYILVGITVDRPKSNEAAIKYFLLGSFASAIFLYGIALVYGVTATTDFATIGSAISENGLESNKILLAGLGLLVVGLAFKIAVFPFHAWAPDAYQGASAPVAAFLAAASKAASLAVLGRVCMVAFASEAEFLSLVLIGFAVLSMIVGSVIAITQTDMKRLLAYSSIAHAGYALLGFISATSESGTSEGTSATMIYAFLYVFMTLGAFGVVVTLGKRGENLDGYQGLAAQRPGTAALMLLFLLSLTGIPPTAGFAAKFVVIHSIVNTGHLALAVLAVLCSVISAFVYLRVAVFMYMKDPQEVGPSRCPLAVSMVLVVAALVTVLGGIFPSGLTQWAVAP